MKRSLRDWSWLAALVVAMVGCSRQPPPQVRTPAPTSDPQPGAMAVPGDVLRQDELATESVKAADGDPLAAERVASYYAFVDPKNKDTEFWIRVAIENGSTLWIDLYAQQLADEGGPDRCRRALYWIRRAVDLEPEKSSTFSARIEDLRSRLGCEVLRNRMTPLIPDLRFRPKQGGRLA